MKELKKATGNFIQILILMIFCNSNKTIENTIKKIKKIQNRYFFRKCSLFFK